MKWLVSVLGCFLFIGVVLTVGFWLPAPAEIADRKLLSYDQFISISLTAITVVLSVIALLVAYLAFEGKGQIIDKAREVAAQEFQKMKPLLIQELKSDASEQVTQFLAQKTAEHEELVKKNFSGTTDIQVPDDLKELTK